VSALNVYGVPFDGTPPAGWGKTFVLPAERTLEDVRRYAEVSAEQGGEPWIYRVFEQTPGSATGERFVTAFLTMDGKVEEWKDVSFPDLRENEK